MSTRANVLINPTTRQCDNSIWLYRHHDGYTEEPHGALGHIRQVLQSCTSNDPCIIATALIRFEVISGYDLSKSYSFELTDGEHGDIEYLYVINAETKSITVNGVNTNTSS